MFEASFALFLTLFGLIWSAAVPTSKVGSQWDPDGRSIHAQAPSGGSVGEVGSQWDPNGSPNKGRGELDPNG